MGCYVNPSPNLFVSLLKLFEVRLRLYNGLADDFVTNCHIV